MLYPLLYEINTRCWLNRLGANRRCVTGLGEVPESELDAWERLGFTHIWLMGVWTTGPRSRACALAPEMWPSYREALPDCQDADVAGSPYAIAEYRVPDLLGGESGLASFRQRLHRRGMKLLLDFVPNHLGLDHTWVTVQPDLFVQSERYADGTYPQATRVGERWLAHGRDPYFPPWTDTVQLDYRNAATRAAMQNLLLSIASRCDGVRCDMAMLLLNDVFAKTWERFPCNEGHLPLSPSPELWQQAIEATKQRYADFLFLAEVYWGLESRLRCLGFDFTYDKELYDRTVHRQAAGVQQHLLCSAPGGVAASAHFLENHDEPRIASILSSAEQEPAALSVLSLPGMRLLHEGQMEGWRIRVPVQLSRRPEEYPDTRILELYERLLAAIKNSAVGRGTANLIAPREAWPGNPTFQNFVLVQWQAEAAAFDLAVINFASHAGQCCAPLQIEWLADRQWSMNDMLGGGQRQRTGSDLPKQGLHFELPAHGAQLIHFRPVG